MPLLKRKTGRRLRVATAVALLGLAGCAEDAAPAKPAAARSMSVFSFDIVPLGQADAGDTMILADLMQQEARRRKLGPAAGGGPFRVGGVMDAASGPNGLYVVAVLDINGADGKRIHRIVDGGLHPKGQTLEFADLQRLAANTVSKIAAWSEASNGPTGSTSASAAVEADAVPYAGIDDTLAPSDSTGSIDAAAAFPAAPPSGFEIAMGPAPGDGADALKAALIDALRKAAPLPGRYLLRGEVTVSTVPTGDMGVSIRWFVRTPDGRLIGTVTQEQAVSPSRIASYWGDLATDAAEPAATGILALLKPESRLPGNAS
ncbi:MAG TPA: hypothetical protein VF449_06055 [Parvibaculum sp.]